MKKFFKIFAITMVVLLTLEAYSFRKVEAETVYVHDQVGILSDEVKAAAEESEVFIWTFEEGTDLYEEAEKLIQRGIQFEDEYFICMTIDDISLSGNAPEELLKEVSRGTTSELIHNGQHNEAAMSAIEAINGYEIAKSNQADTAGIMMRVGLIVMVLILSFLMDGSKNYNYDYCN